MKKWSVSFLVLAFRFCTLFVAVAGTAHASGWSKNPILGTLSPGSVAAGGPAFSLTVTGSNFSGRCVVLWNGSRRPTQVVNSTKVIATIFATDIANAGTDSVGMLNMRTGTQSNTLPFNVTAPAVSVTLSPASASLQPGQSQQFSATVSGTTNSGVTWQASGGNISSTGLYTAPAAAGSYVVMATSVADPNKSASAAVTVSASVSISIAPASVSLTTGAKQQFTAPVSGTSNTAVTWSASGGTISSSGLYTAPSTAGTYTVIATSAADPTKSASATASVTSAPSTALLGDTNIEGQIDSTALGEAEAFPTTAALSGTVGYLAAYLDGSSTAAQLTLGLYSDASGHPGTLLTQASQPQPQAGTWTTIAVPAANVVAGARYWIAILGTSGGSIAFRDATQGNCASETSAQTTLSALPATWSTGARWTTCTLSAYGSGLGVQAPVAVTVTPSTASVPAAGTQQFAATVTGSVNTAVNWSATGGTISAAGLYNAPSTAGTYTVKATSAADSTKSAAATVTVTAPVVAVSLSPLSASLQAAATQQFTATVTGTSNTAVTWSATGGTISAGGLYTAPGTAGTYSVSAISAADPTKSAAATVTVSVQNIAVSVSPNPASLYTGGSQQFTAIVTGTLNNAVTWSANGGTISSAGLYTAPSVAGTYAVNAVSATDPTKSGSASVAVGVPPAHSASLSWSASTSVAGYNVYRGTQSGGPYSMLNLGLDTSTSYMDLSVQGGQTYYYVVTAVDASGNESAFSNEVLATIPLP